MTLSDYYRDVYLPAHTNVWNRRLHMLGLLATLAYVVALCVAAAVSNPMLLMLLGFAPLVVYPFAWFGHLVFEKNNPLAWSDPLRAKICDVLMAWDWLRGKVAR